MSRQALCFFFFLRRDFCFLFLLRVQRYKLKQFRCPANGALWCMMRGTPFQPGAFYIWANSDTRPKPHWGGRTEIRGRETTPSCNIVRAPGAALWVPRAFSQLVWAHSGRLIPWAGSFWKGRISFWANTYFSTNQSKAWSLKKIWRNWRCHEIVLSPDLRIWPLRKQASNKWICSSVSEWMLNKFSFNQKNKNTLIHLKKLILYSHWLSFN